MSSRVVVLTKRFCTNSIENLCEAISACGYSYEKTNGGIFVDGCSIETKETVAYMRIWPTDTKSIEVFDRINRKLAGLESQLRAQSIEKNRLEQEQAKREEEMYRVRRLQREQKQLEYEQEQLALERQNFVEAKKKAIITKAKEMGYSVEERAENGVVKLKLVKRSY